MIIPAPIPYRKSSRLAKRKKTSGVPTPPVTALQLVSADIASFEGSDATLTLVFDNTADDPIVDLGAALPTKWTGTIEAYEFLGNALELASYNTITLYMGNAGESTGESRISYTASPSDVGTASGRMLAAISDHPMG